ncbi:unnamed protein product [Brassica oleracea]
MCIFFELIRKGSCSRIGLALFPKELMSTTFPLPQSLPLDSEEDDDFEFNSIQTRQVSVAVYIIGWSMLRSPDAGRARMLNFAPQWQAGFKPRSVSGRNSLNSLSSVYNCSILFPETIGVESKGISPDSNRIMAFGNRIHDFVVPGRKIFWLSALDVGTAGT